MTPKKAANQYPRSFPSQGQSISVLSLFTAAEIVSAVLPFALVMLFWLSEVVA